MRDVTGGNDEKADFFTLPVPMRNQESVVREGFWPKFRRVVGRIPFADDVLAAYYCAMDPATPRRVKAILFAALAYFILPTDVIPDFIVSFGFTDDATVLAAAMAAIGTAIKDQHREKARAVFNGEG
ncbi:MAG: YkvA family protein [Pseudomonadota bacterium]